MKRRNFIKSMLAAIPALGLAKVVEGEESEANRMPVQSTKNEKSESVTIEPRTLEELKDSKTFIVWCRTSFRLRIGDSVDIDSDFNCSPAGALGNGVVVSSVRSDGLVMVKLGGISND